MDREKRSVIAKFRVHVQNEMFKKIHLPVGDL